VSRLFAKKCKGIKAFPANCGIPRRRELPALGGEGHRAQGEAQQYAAHQMRSTTTATLETVEAAPQVSDHAAPEPVEDTPPQQQPPAQTLPAPCQDHPQGDFPQDEDIGVLGRACLDWVPLLQELIRRCLGEQREYLRLSRRAGGNPGRSFAALAREKQRQAKRLCAAYFLISGVHYWPQGEEPAPAGSYLGALRRRFRQEQTDMAACLAGAEGCTDPSLSQLFQDIAKEDWDIACRIRTLVEQA